jgi:hypothetical protein
LPFVYWMFALFLLVVHRCRDPIPTSCHMWFHAYFLSHVILHYFLLYGSAEGSLSCFLHSSFPLPVWSGASFPLPVWSGACLLCIPCGHIPWVYSCTCTQDIDFKASMSRYL